MCMEILKHFETSLLAQPFNILTLLDAVSFVQLSASTVWTHFLEQYLEVLD